MKKRRVTYQGIDGEIIFNETVFYFELAPVGRKIEYLTKIWVVDDILERWDKDDIIVTLKTAESTGFEYPDRIKLDDYLSERAASGLAYYLSHKNGAKTIFYSWDKEQLKSIDQSELKKLRNFGERSQREVREFLENLNR